MSGAVTTKYTCHGCGQVFYLDSAATVPCPACGTLLNPEGGAPASAAPTPRPSGAPSLPGRTGSWLLDAQPSGQVTPVPYPGRIPAAFPTKAAPPPSAGRTAPSPATQPRAAVEGQVRQAAGLEVSEGVPADPLELLKAAARSAPGRVARTAEEFAEAGVETPARTAGASGLLRGLVSRLLGRGTSTAAAEGQVCRPSDLDDLKAPWSRRRVAVLAGALAALAALIALLLVPPRERRSSETAPQPDGIARAPATRVEVRPVAGALVRQTLDPERLASNATERAPEPGAPLPPAEGAPTAETDATAPRESGAPRPGLPDRNPAEPELRREVAVLEAKIEELRKEVQSLEASLEKRSEAARLALEAQAILDRRSDPRAALELAEAALERQAGLAEAHRIRGHALDAIGSVGEALSAFESADAESRKSLGRGDPEAMLWAGELSLTRLGNRARAREYYSRAAEAAPPAEESGSPLAIAAAAHGLVARARVSLLDGRLDESEAAAARAARLRPTSALAQLVLGEIALARGLAETAAARARQLEEAGRLLRRAVELDPGLSQARLARARVLIELARQPGFGLARLARWMEARGLIESALSLSPHMPEAHITLAELFLEESPVRDPASALRHAREAVRLTDRADARALARLAESQLAAGDRAAAAGTLREALRLDPWDTRLRAELRRCESAGD